MKRLAFVLLLISACGDDLAAPPPIEYTNPTGGKLRLVKDPASAKNEVVLDLVVGDQPLTGYSVGFDLPLDTTKVKLVGFTPGTALSPGTAPVAASSAMPKIGPLKGTLVTAQSQKASGEGAVATDTQLATGTVLYTIKLQLIDNSPLGVVFDGTASGFVLPSGGMRNRAGETVVAPNEVAIGRLEVTQQ